ncbi:hypothetical protein FHX48_002452 [Microbacterium halimionae]|uniref:Uncharacterized protein n=1 Tax=Microbacterium halimionae TaxID=1526413 RepID=A0A7W3JR38_9MICO|nr:hypothetical protein [Microbacterium halimionae]NII95987.1 hypothetical protein [Microbacterium halimionae]
MLCRAGGWDATRPRGITGEGVDLLHLFSHRGLILGGAPVDYEGIDGSDVEVRSLKIFSEINFNRVEI